MSQHDYNLADQAGAAFRADLNSALAAIVSQNSGATEPAATFAYQWWADTASGRLKQRNAANSAWLDRGPLAAVYATFGELVKFVKGADIASAATVDLGTATGNTVDVTHSTGTTAITSLGGASLQAGAEIETRFVISGGTLTLTHHATNLYLAGGANITLANGDVIRWRKMHSSNAEWKMVGGVVDGWTDYSASSTIVGWSSFITKQIYYKDIGKTRFVTFTLYGTSNSTSATFTVPSASSNTIATNNGMRVIDNGVEGPVGLMGLPENSSTVTCYRSQLAAWTNSGVKLVSGQFTYQLP